MQTSTKAHRAASTWLWRTSKPRVVLLKNTMATKSAAPSLQYNDDLFNYTRGRFVINEAHEIAQHHTRFNVEELGRVAAESIGAKSCVSIEKFPDGKYNRAMLLTMNDGAQVVAKIPNPNAGRPHFTIASEVATMEFVREIFGIPVPKVHAWRSSEQNAVGAEYVIMEKVQGIELEKVWAEMEILDRLKVLKTITEYQARWASASFHKYGSLYFAKDLPGQSDNGPLYTDESGSEICNARFAVGPSTGRKYLDDGRLSIDFDRGPWKSLEEYHVAFGQREIACVNGLPRLPKSPINLCGPGTYQPTREKKLKAINCYLQLVEHLLPADRTIARSCLWHGVHERNIFVNPANPTEIVGLTGWQNTELMPLYNHVRQPSFIDHEGPEHEGLERPKLPKNFNDLEPVEQAPALALYTKQYTCLAYRVILKKLYPLLFRTWEFQQTQAYMLMLLASKLLVDGEPVYLAHVAELEETWSEVADTKYPFKKFSEEEKVAMEADVVLWNRGTSLMGQIQDALGDAFPELKVVRKEDYEVVVGVFRQARDQIVERCAKNEEEREVWRREFPFKCS